MALSDQLKAYYKLDESSGNAVDALSIAPTLTNTTSKSYVAGLVNNGIDFGSSIRNTTELTTTTNILTSGTSSFSISLWFKMNLALSAGNPNPGLFILPYRSTGSSVVAIIPEWNAGSPRISIVRRTSSDSTAYTTFGNDTTTWHHIVSVYDSVEGTISGYLDGVAFSTTGVATSGSFNASTYPISLGGSYMSNNATAIVDEVGIWQRTLSSAEASVLYASGLGLQYPFLNSYSLDLDAGEYTFTDTSARVFTSTIANVSKPATSNLANYLSIGGGFELLVGSLNRLLISPLGSFSNQSKVASSLVNVSLGAAGALWSNKRFPWTESTPWTSEGGIINENKI